MAVLRDERTRAERRGVLPGALHRVVHGGQPGALGEIPTPAIESGPYLSYGLQWIAFGIMAPAAVAGAIASYGSSAQQETYLPAFTDEKKPAVASLAITRSGSGSSCEKVMR